MKDVENPQGFLNEGAVTEAKLRHESLELSESGAAISAIAQAAMEEVSTVFDGPIQDSNVDFSLGGPLTREELETVRARMGHLAPGEYLIFRDRAFFRTADGKMQAAQAYVRRLEKAVINAMNFQQNELAKVSAERDFLATQLGEFRAKALRRKRRALAKRRATLRGKAALRCLGGLRHKKR